MTPEEGVAFALLGAFLFFVLRECKSPLAAFVPLLGGMLLFIAALSRYAEVGLFSLFAQYGVGTDMIRLVFKVLSAGLLTEAGADICEELGAKTLAGRLIFFGNAEIFLLVLPTLEEILKLSLEMLS